MALRTFFLLLVVAVHPSLLWCAKASKGISVRLDMPTRFVCVGQDSLPLQATLTNNSHHTLTLNPIGVHGGLSVYKYKGDKTELVTSYLAEIIREKVTNGTWLRIAPGRSVIVPFELSLKDDLKVEDAQAFAGTFSLQIMFQGFNKSHAGVVRFIGSSTSNEILFVVTSCASSRTDSGNSSSSTAVHSSNLAGGAD